MSPYAQGRPFNSGPVWDAMKFPQSNQGFSTAGGSYPVAGSYMGNLQSVYSGIPSDITGEDRTLLALAGLQGLTAEQNRQQNREFMQDILKQRREESLEANKLAQQNAVMRSFLVDVPAAIGNAFAQRQRYTPERIQIAANAAQRATPSYGVPNYYGFVG
jgi:hypothetical protein